MSSEETPVESAESSAVGAALQRPLRRTTRASSRGPESPARVTRSSARLANTPSKTKTVETETGTTPSRRTRSSTADNKGTPTAARKSTRGKAKESDSPRSSTASPEERVVRKSSRTPVKRASSETNLSRSESSSSTIKPSARAGSISPNLMSPASRTRRKSNVYSQHMKSKAPSASALSLNEISEVEEEERSQEEVESPRAHACVVRRSSTPGREGSATPTKSSSLKNISIVGRPPSSLATPPKKKSSLDGSDRRTSSSPEVMTSGASKIARKVTPSRSSLGVRTKEAPNQDSSTEKVSHHNGVLDSASVQVASGAASDIAEVEARGDITEPLDQKETTEAANLHKPTQLESSGASFSTVTVAKSESDSQATILKDDVSIESTTRNPEMSGTKEEPSPSNCPPNEPVAEPSDEDPLAPPNSKARITYSRSKPQKECESAAASDTVDVSIAGPRRTMEFSSSDEESSSVNETVVDTLPESGDPTNKSDSEALKTALNCEAGKSESEPAKPAENQSQTVSESNQSASNKAAPEIPEVGVVSCTSSQIKAPSSVVEESDSSGNASGTETDAQIPSESETAKTISEVSHPCAEAPLKQAVCSNLTEDTIVDGGENENEKENSAAEVVKSAFQSEVDIDSTLESEESDKSDSSKGTKQMLGSLHADTVTPSEDQHVSCGSLKLEFSPEKLPSKTVAKVVPESTEAESSGVEGESDQAEQDAVSESSETAKPTGKLYESGIKASSSESVLSEDETEFVGLATKPRDSTESESNVELEEEEDKSENRHLPETALDGNESSGSSEIMRILGSSNCNKSPVGVSRKSKAKSPDPTAEEDASPRKVLKLNEEEDSAVVKSAPSPSPLPDNKQDSDNEKENNEGRKRPKLFTARRRIKRPKFTESPLSEMERASAPLYSMILCNVPEFAGNQDVQRALVKSGLRDIAQIHKKDKLWVVDFLTEDSFTAATEFYDKIKIFGVRTFLLLVGNDSLTSDDHVALNRAASSLQENGRPAESEPEKCYHAVISGVPVSATKKQIIGSLNDQNFTTIKQLYAAKPAPDSGKTKKKVHVTFTSEKVKEAIKQGRQFKIAGSGVKVKMLKEIGSTDR